MKDKETYAAQVRVSVIIRLSLIIVYTLLLILFCLIDTHFIEWSISASSWSDHELFEQPSYVSAETIIPLGIGTDNPINNLHTQTWQNRENVTFAVLSFRVNRRQSQSNSDLMLDAWCVNSINSLFTAKMERCGDVRQPVDGA